MNCDKCGGDMWDESKGKFWNGGKTKEGKNKPRWKCKDKDGCGRVIYEKASEAAPTPDRAPQRPTGPLAPVYGECMEIATRALMHYAKGAGLSFTATDLVAATATLFIQASQSGRPVKQPKESKPTPEDVAVAKMRREAESPDDLPF